MQVYEPGDTPLKKKAPGGVDPTQTAAPATSAGDTVPAGDRVIPGAGIYGQQQANAELAYQNAVAQAQARKNSLYHQYGLTNTGEVDPFNQYGRYQSLLQQQGSALDQVQENAMERGLGGGPGLGNQAERGLRYANAVQNLGFQGDVNQIGTDYGLAMGDAEINRRNAMTQALQDARNSAWGDWTMPDMSTENVDASGPAAPPVTSAPKVTYTTKVGQSKSTPNLSALKKVTQPTKKAPAKQTYLPGQAPTSLAVINNKPKKKK